VLMQYDGSVTVLTMEGRLDHASADAAWAQWSALIADGHDRFVVDLSGLAYASSIGLRVLIRGAKAATVVAFGLTPFLANIFLISGLSRLIPVFDGLAEARADLIARAHRHRADDSPSS
jgi:anti-sigma B factor antagonist